MSEAFDSIKHEEESLLMHTYGRYPIAIDRGQDAHLWDFDGKEYIDLLAGIAVTSLGHANPELCDTLSKQAQRLWHVSNLFYQQPQLDLARLLLSTSHHDRAFFCNSGAEANEAAIKLARRYMTTVLGKKDCYEVITLTDCFHGRTLATLAATGRESLAAGFRPLPEGFSQVPSGDFAALEAAVSDKTCAILLEVIQGEGGVLPLAKDYVQKVAALCNEKGIILICDEVQAGLCRSGKFWAFQNYGIEPDIISMAKALANGLPMGGILATEEVARAFVPGSHATTFGGGALVAAVAAKTVEIMLRDHLAERAAALGAHFKEQAQALAREMPGKIKEVRGMGLFIGIELTDSAKQVWESLLDKGFICNLCHEKTLRLLPPLIIEERDLDNFLATLKEILAAQA